MADQLQDKIRQEAINKYLTKVSDDMPGVVLNGVRYASSTESVMQMIDEITMLRYRLRTITYV